MDTVKKITEEFEICGSRSGAVADPSLLGCYAVCNLRIFTESVNIYQPVQHNIPVRLAF